MRKKLFFLVYFLLLSSTILAQEKTKPITIHSLIGEKLDRAEEEYFKLFPMIEGVRKQNSISTQTAHFGQLLYMNRME